MPRLIAGAVPAYRLHKARNAAVVTLDGRDYYLGPFGTPSSKQKYAGLIRSWQNRHANPAAADQSLETSDRPIINELILAFLQYAVEYYKPNSGENKEAGCIDDALKVLQECGYGRDFADGFRPKDLKRVREAMVQKDWSRTYINCQINRIKRMFRYAVEEDLVSGSIYHALLAVKGLRRGTPGVRETKKVRPVPAKHIKAVLKKTHKVLRAMILFAYYTGARPGEVCALQLRHVDRANRVWVYLVPPETNKTEHHEQDRKIYIGPRAQRVLGWLIEGLQPDESVFSPIRAEALRQASRRESRKTPLWPSHVKLQAAKRIAESKRPKRNTYDSASFRRAINRLCTLAKVPAWTPNQLRHNAGTRFRKRHGLEVARILLGHRKMNTTEIYAEADVLKATLAVKKTG